jgi:alkylation response protein AidB-like acyl-CoA dehydrogenase
MNKSFQKNDEQSDVSLLTKSSGGNIGKQNAIEIAEEAREKDSKQPSFAGQLFMGNFNSSLLLPFPRQDPEDKKIGDQYIEQVTELLKKYIDPEEIDATRTIPKEAFEAMTKLGLFAMKVPKEYDGLGFSQTNYNRVVMKVASYCGSTATLLSAHQSIGVPQPLKMFGSEQQKRKFFPRFRQGAISAFALTEPDVGSDPARMTCEAKLSEDGTYYTLNGEKLWCTNGTIADVIIVMAQTAPKIVNGKEKKQISAFIVETNTPGVEVVHRCEFMGLNGIYNGLLNFKNVKVPAENLLGDEGRGLAIALSTVNVGRLTLPAACTAAAKQCLSICRRWGGTRIQWGLPVALHEAGAEKVAYIAATTLAMEAITWLTCGWIDSKTADIRIEAAMAKLFCTESIWKIVDMTMQLRGGRGYEKARSLKARGELPFPVERIMRDCRINLILEGSSEIMKLFLAREAMDPHLKRLGPLLKGKMSTPVKIKEGMKLLGFYAQWYTKELFKSFSTPSFKELGPLEPHFRFVERTAHKLSRTLFYYMALYQQKLERRQMLLGRLMEIGTDLFAMSAVCAYATTLCKENPEDRSPLTLADYFCSMARRRIDDRFRDLADNDDRKANYIAKEIIDKEYKWLEEEGVMSLGPDENRL